MALNLPINQSGAQIQSALDAQNQNLLNLISTQQGQINQLVADIQALTLRVAALEKGQVFVGPFIGQEVHLRNWANECIPAIIIRDPSQSRTSDLITVRYISFVHNNGPAEWAEASDIIQDIGANAPLTAWHIPENAMVNP